MTDLLDVVSGVEWIEDGQRPELDEYTCLLWKAHCMLSNGMGGHDYAGLPYVCGILGIDDAKDVIHAFNFFKQNVKKHEQQSQS